MIVWKTLGILKNPNCKHEQKWIRYSTWPIKHTAIIMLVFNNIAKIIVIANMNISCYVITLHSQNTCPWQNDTIIRKLNETIICNETQFGELELLIGNRNYRFDAFALLDLDMSENKFWPCSWKCPGQSIGGYPRGDHSSTVGLDRRRPFSLMQ